MLPEIFKNKITIDNTINTFRGSAKSTNTTTNTIPDKFPAQVYIKTYLKEYNTTLINRTKNYLITIDKHVIYIDDIVKIEKR